MKPFFVVTLVFSFVSGGGNNVAIDLIVQHVHSQLEEVGAKHTHTNTEDNHSPNP